MNSGSHSVNGVIAIQWEWSNFDPSQNQNPLTDYDKTLQNWLRPRDNHVTKNMCQSAVTGYVWANTWNIRPYLFYSDLFFCRTRLLRWSVDWFNAQCLKLREITQGSAFWGLHGGRPHLGGQIPPKPTINRQKISHFVREMDDNQELGYAIEEWRQWRDARLRCCKCIGQGQTTVHCFTACDCITVDQIHTKFSRNHGNFNIFIWMCWKMKWRHLTNDITITSDEWQQFVFFYCITNWTKHLQLQNRYTLSTF